ncbi:MAG TPA: hypothetical protein VFT99_09715, partial [Roseiflexaceae bacterium]|nr:hypothetical protein [Roseiflexaceae bacterium]
MSHPLLDASRCDEPPARFLEAVGTLFAVFGQQDSGNVSYGVLVGEQRFFVKTAGDPGDTAHYLSHQGRVALLRNAIELHAGTQHPALIPLLHVLESPYGPMLVYPWFVGELVGARSAERDDPRSSFQRFRALPPGEIAACLDALYDLHAQLGVAGWVAHDLYDRCLMYEFARRRLGVIDLDTYQRSPFVNTMGRMFGSTRFMAPEEFQR